MSAVTSGYLDYKDCTLDGKALETLETLENWVCMRVQKEESKYLQGINLQVLLGISSIMKDPGEHIGSIQELVAEMFDVIVGDIEKAEAKSAESRYREVFGDVSEDDVEDLNEQLENKSLKAKQEQTSKQQALQQLEHELSKKFRNRIK